MKKRIAVCVMCTMILTGCGFQVKDTSTATEETQKEQETNYDGQDKHIEIDNSEEVVDQEQQENVEQEEDIEQPKPRTFESDIERVDNSVMDEDGIVLASIFYDRFYFTNPDDVLEQINYQIEKKAMGFLQSTDSKDANERACEAKNDDGMKETLREYPYQNNSSIENVYVSDSELSITSESAWFCGGVYVLGTTGLNYSLDTGDEIIVSEILGENAKERIIAALEEVIRNGETSSFHEDAIEKVRSYNMADFNFFFDKDNVCVIFDQYEIASGHLGPIEVTIPR